MIVNTALKNNYNITFSNNIAEVRSQINKSHNALHALQVFNIGAVIANFSARETLREPNYLTVQTGETTHILLAPEYLQYINHSCNPNCFFNTATMQLKCLKPIAPNDEFTFFYPSTEWQMEQPFACQCNNKNCLSIIQGANFLNEQALNNYRFTTFIAAKIASKVYA